jgi:hypothetical protein
LQRLQHHDAEPSPNAAGAVLPRTIGKKFDSGGRVLPFPGNTIICHLPATGPLHSALWALHDELSRSPLAAAGLYTLLPPSSWHMTVFEGVCDQVRDDGFWPADLSPDATLQECTALFERKLATFDPGTTKPFHMVIEGLEPLVDGISLRLVPASVDENEKLRRLRNRLAELLRIRHPGHEAYVFHVSLAYLLRKLDQEQHRALDAVLQRHQPALLGGIALGAPEFCRFDSMFVFDRQHYLVPKSKAEAAP